MTICKNKSLQICFDFYSCTWLKDINKMDLGWSVEEAEVAAKDRCVWKFLVHQAAGASMHEADR